MPSTSALWHVSVLSANLLAQQMGFNLLIPSTLPPATHLSIYLLFYAYCTSSKSLQIRRLGPEELYAIFFFLFLFFLNNTFVLLHSIDQSATPQNRSNTILWDLFHAAGVPGMLTTGLSDKLWFLMTPQLKCFLHKGRWLSPTVRQRYCPHGCFKGSLALTFSAGSFLPVKEKRSLVHSELPYHVWVHTIELKDKHSS